MDWVEKQTVENNINPQSLTFQEQVTGQAFYLMFKRFSSVLAQCSGTEKGNNITF